EQARGLVEPGDRPAIAEERLFPRIAELAHGEQRHPTEGSCPIDDVSVGEQLGVALAAFDEPSSTGGCERPVAFADECREILGPQAKLAVEREREVRAEARIEEPTRAGEH